MSVISLRFALRTTVILFRSLAVSHGFSFSGETPGVLMAFLGSALVTVSGEQPDATQKWTAPAAEARKKNPVAVSESSVAAGQKIYLKRCVGCHGKTGDGDGADAADLGIHPAKLSNPLIRKETDGELFWKITVEKSQCRIMARDYRPPIAGM